MGSAVTSKIDVASLALRRLGLKSINSFTSTTRGQVCESAFDPLLFAIISMYPWRCMMTKKQLGRLSEAPINEWTYKFQLPSDLVGDNWAVFDTSTVGAKPYKLFERFGQTLYSDATALWIDYPTEKAVAEWPPYFARLMELALTADIAMTLTEKKEVESLWYMRAWGTPQEAGQGGYFQTAKSLDAMGTPPQQLQDFSLIDARFGG